MGNLGAHFDSAFHPTPAIVSGRGNIHVLSTLGPADFPSYARCWRGRFQLHDDLSLLGKSLAPAPFVKVKDSLQNRPFVPVVLRHENGRVSMSAEVFLDGGGASTGIFLPYRQVQKLQLAPLHHTEEFEGWGGGTATHMQQYTSVWVSATSGIQALSLFRFMRICNTAVPTVSRYRSLQDLKTAGLDGFLA